MRSRTSVKRASPVAASMRQFHITPPIAAQTAARLDPELRRTYYRLKFRRASGVAKVAIARRLAVRLYWMLRQQIDYAQLVRMSGSPSSGVVPLRAGSGN